MARDADDAELLARFLRGDESAFTRLMRRHEDRIFAVAFKITADRGDALEATQETFVSLWRRASSFEGRAQLGTWLYRIAINAAHDQVRRRRRTPLLEDDEPRDVPDPGAVVEDAGLRVDLARALAELPDEYREAVALHDLGGMPYDEIAVATGVALGTVKSRIHRGRLRLRELLAEHRELFTG